MNNITSPTANNPHKEINYQRSALESTISLPIADPSKHSTFLLQKQLYDEMHPVSDDTMDISDDETIVIEKLAPNMNSVSMTMMFKTPGKEEVIDDDDAPIEAILKINEILKALKNKVPYRIGPYKNIKSWKLSAIQTQQIY